MKPKNKRIPIIVVVLLSLAGLTVWWLLRPKLFYYAGTVEGTEVTLSARVASVIATLPVKEGEAVQKGRTLLTLTGEDYKLAAELANKEFKRAQRLLQSGSLPQAEFDKIRFQKNKADLAVDWCTIAAPQDARVEQLYKEPGEMVAPGMQLLTLTDISEVWAFIYVEQTRLAFLSPGLVVKGLLPEMPGKTFKGTIAMIRDKAEFTPKNVQTRDERERLVYGVKIRFDNSEKILKPGMTIEVELPEEK